MYTCKLIIPGEQGEVTAKQSFLIVAAGFLIDSGISIVFCHMTEVACVDDRIYVYVGNVISYCFKGYYFYYLITIAHLVSERKCI